MLSFSGLSLLLAALLPAGTVVPSDTLTAFVNITVIPMDREQVLAGQTVLVRNGRIAALGPASTVAVPAQAVRVDGQGKWLIPGLADMHVHEGWSSAKGLLTYVANGVLTVRDMSGPAHDSDRWPDYFALRERVRAGELLGPAIYFASAQVWSIDSPEAAVELVNQWKTRGVDLIKIYQPEIDRVTLDSFVAAARRAALPFGGHMPGGVTLEEWLDAHPVTIEHLVGYHELLPQSYLNPEESDRDKASNRPQEPRGATPGDSALAAVATATRRAGVWNVPTLAIGFGTDADSGKGDKAEDWQIRARVIRALRDAGAGLLVGSDIGPWGPTVHTELRLLVKAGLTPYQALEAGTRNAALALGTADSAGTVAVGKRADLVVLNGDPLQDISNTTKIAGVMVGGRWLPRAELDSLLLITPYKLPSPAPHRKGP